MPDLSSMPEAVFAAFRSHRLAVGRDYWRAAAAVAGWRVAVNDRFRVRDRDRGEAKNALNDIQGVVGELAGMRVVEGLVPPPVAVHHDLLSVQGPVDDVDVTAILSSGDTLRIEAKCHLEAAAKRLLLINVRAHER